MKTVVAALSLAFSLALEVSVTPPPVHSGTRRPGLPPITVPSRSLRLEWAFRPSTPLTGSATNQVPVIQPISFRNVASGRFLGVHNGTPVLVSNETMEFHFEPREGAKVLNYQREMAIRSRSGQYLVAARLGERPVLVLSSRPNPEWVVLGGQAGTPVLVDAVIALGNAVVRHNELVYCPGTLNGLDWDIQCPAAPSGAGEQPTGVAPSPKR